MRLRKPSGLGGTISQTSYCEYVAKYCQVFCSYRWLDFDFLSRYGLAMISVVLLPTALFISSPLWCNPCLSEEFCGDHDIGDKDLDERWKTLGKSPRVNNYCLHNEASAELYSILND